MAGKAIGFKLFIADDIVEKMIAPVIFGSSVALDLRGKQKSIAKPAQYLCERRREVNQGCPV
jgi:hypothetical protein